MTSCFPRSDSSVSSSVTYWPLLVLRGFSIIFSWSNSSSPICLGDAMLMLAPAVCRMSRSIFVIILSFCGKLSQLIHSIPVPVMGGICILLFGVIATSGFRVLVESKVDYSKSSNLVMTSVIMIIGLSGAKISFGAFSVQGMVLATLVAIIMSLLFKLFAKLNLLNE